jgi:hypothetical protein
MTKFLKQNNQFTINNTDGLELTDTLPTGTYALSFNKDMGFFYLSPIEGYTVGKVYGDAGKNAERILNTFRDRPSGTGVLLSGDKGSGKTMLAKILSINGLKENIVTLVINEPLFGEDFNKVIQSIKQPAIVIFDEYEKVYSDRNEQEALLTLLDGIYPSKKLFIMTTNDKWAVNSYMLNRPGRLFYNIEYTGLEENFIEEYCRDNLINKLHLNSLMKIYKIFSSFNFDMLKAIVEEMNRYNEDAPTAIKIMNIKPEDKRSEYKISLTQSGKVLKTYDTTIDAHPLENFNIPYYPNKKAEENDNCKSLYVTQSNIVSIVGSTYTFKIDDFVLVLKEDQQKVFDLAERFMAL